MKAAMEEASYVVEEVGEMEITVISTMVVVMDTPEEERWLLLT